MLHKSQSLKVYLIKFVLFFSNVLSRKKNKWDCLNSKNNSFVWTCWRTVFFTLGFFLSEPSAMGHYLGLGLSAVESGNDTFRPAATVGLGIGTIAFGEVSAWGRTMGPIAEQTILGSIGGKWALGLSTLYVSVGISSLREETRIAFVSEEIERMQEVSISNGIRLGTGFTLFRMSHYRCDAEWATHIYPAGINGILLAHGRKQMISLTGGVDL